ncbi:MAG: CBS domain-containing protein [Armatimonadetes bacterium]|nr:CBS domain-containing protein [Armatimonadota bacterium]
MISPHVRIESQQAIQPGWLEALAAAQVIERSRSVRDQEPRDSEAPGGPAPQDTLDEQLEWDAAFERPGASPAAEHMTRQVTTISAEATVRELAQLLSHRRLSGVPVVAKDGKVVGVVSQADIASHAAHVWARRASPGGWLSHPFQEEPGCDTMVSDIMTPFVYYATENADALELADLMLEKQIHRVIVLRGEELVGIVSSLDLVRVFRDDARRRSGLE